MQESENTGAGLIIAGIIGLIIGLSIGPTEKDISILKEEVDSSNAQCEIVKEEYGSALEEANNNIEEANNKMYDANSYAWSSYNEMGTALDDLSDVAQSDDPDTNCN